MIERHITFRVPADRAKAFERFFADEYRPPIATFPGFVAADLLRQSDDPTSYCMILRWQDGEAAAGWRNSDVHEGLQPALRELHEGMTIVAFDVVD